MACNITQHIEEQNVEEFNENHGAHMNNINELGDEQPEYLQAQNQVQENEQQIQNQ